MSRVVWKFSVPVGEPCTRRLPAGADVIATGCQLGPDIVHFWAEVAPDQPLVERHFQACGTGEILPEPHVHHGSVITADGKLVWHLYEVMA